ncbi:hypothetical protein B0H11DRAFT_2078949 [Mycena galericulata]|nr:hypothetical protein B0H11DRAFT_2078949 [Mycena galericulata]
MRKRWKAGGGEVAHQTHAPPRLDKAKGKVHAWEEPMDVDVDGDVDVDVVAAELAPTQPPHLSLAPPPLFRSPHAPPPASGPSPSANFARLSLVSSHPSAPEGPRPAWFSVGAGANVEVLQHEGDAGGVHWVRMEDGAEADLRRMRMVSGVNGTVEAPAAVDAVARAFPSAEAGMLPPVDVGPSPRVRFVQPVVDVLPHDEDVESLADEHKREQDDDALLMAVGEEPYRPSLASPSPTLESSEELAVPLELAPRVLAERGAVSMPVPVESDMPPSPTSPAWGTAASLSPEVSAPAPLARDPSPPRVGAPAPLPVAKLSFKEWQARRKLERAKEGEVAQEREREEQREQERERERRREREKKVAQGEDKENEVVPVKEDGLGRILDGIRRSTVSRKTPHVELPARQDIEMVDALPLVVAPGATPAQSPVADFQSKLKATPLGMTAFVATGNDRLSPLAVSSVLDSRTLPRRLANGIKRETLPFASQTVPAPRLPLIDVAPPSALPQSAQAPEYPSPSFTSNVVRRPAPSLAKPFHVSYQSSSATLTSQRSIHELSKPGLGSPPRSRSLSPTSAAKQRHINGRPPRPRRPRLTPSPPPRLPSTAPFKFHARAASQEEGEILPNSSPPPTPQWPARFGSQPTPRTSPFTTSSGPPTQLRSHQLQRMLPSAPKALRQAQNANAIASSSSGSARGGAPRFNGMGPQTMPRGGP